VGSLRINFIKACTWTILAFIASVAVIYIWSGKWSVALGITTFDHTVAFFLYFFHEQLWEYYRRVRR